MKLSFEDLPEILKEKIKDEEKKVLVAKGLIHFPPEEIISLLIYLIHDENPEIRKDAVKTLSGLPKELWEEGLIKIKWERILREIYTHVTTDFVARNLIRNSNTPPDVLKEIARKGGGEAVKFLSLNITLLQKYPDVAEELLRNPHLEVPAKESIKELLGIKPQEEKKEEITPPSPDVLDLLREETGEEKEREEKVGEEKYIPSQEEIELLKKTHLPRDVLELLGGESLENIPIPKEFLMEEGESTEERRERIAKQLMTMTASQKIKLAIVGNSEVRKLLLRDANKLVALTALRSPKTREGEIEELARSRSVQEDILAEIGNNRMWLKNYKIRLALVQNPKTPLYISSKLLHTLSERDIKLIAKDKNIPSSLASMAKGMLKKKEEKGA